MAIEKLQPIDADMLNQALRSYRKVLVRAAQAELSPEVRELRLKAVARLDLLLAKVVA